MMEKRTRPCRHRPPRLAGVVGHGGRLIASSPKVGSSQPSIGHALARLGRPAALSSAEKVWTGDPVLAAIGDREPAANVGFRT